MEDDTSVKVTVRIRPQLANERIDMCQVCTSVSDDAPMVVLGKDKCFTYDYVMDMPASQQELYNKCSHDLIEGTFEGYNATIFAYGQTGSGKTYTMGSGFDMAATEDQVGIIPRAVAHLFRGIEERKKAAQEKGQPPPDFKVNAQFMELYNEEINDLLDTTRDPSDRTKKSHIKIHEDAGGGIYCVGVTTRPVHSLQDTMQCLQIGTLSRSTASTNMNAQSSRSHAIFTLHIRQTRIVAREQVEEEEGKEIDTTEVMSEFETETLTAKFHFVDLAGSERLKRTGATGDRAKEGISINCGLLALGNVISALGDKAKRGSHVPYRDSKLTRLLQDSLGGNSRTVMIACISPSDRDFMETLNTLKYANRARNIKNKVTVNQDKTSRQITALRIEIAQLQEELREYKSGKRLVGEDGVETINDMFQENTLLQTENHNLRTRIKTLQETIEKLRARNIELLAERDALSVGGEAGDSQVQQLIAGYIQEIEQLRTKLMEAESENEVIRRSASVRSSTRLSVTPAPLHVPMTTTSPSASLELSTSPNNDLLAFARQQLLTEKSKLSMLSSRESKEQNGEKGVDENETSGHLDDHLPLENGDHVENEEDEEDEEEETDSDQDDELKKLAEPEEGKGAEDTNNNEECENLHEDLANLQCEMSIKEKLIDELELSQKRLHAMKAQYEEKLINLQQQIKLTEGERDKIIANLGEVESHSQEKVEKVKNEYQKKLSSMQGELKKVQAAKREHAKLLKNQSHYEKQLRTLQNDLAQLKKIKVKLMNDMKDETQKKRALEARHSKESARHKKEQRVLEAKMKKLEADKRQKDIVLKRKMEEIESLKKNTKPSMSAAVAGRVTTATGGAYERPPPKPMPTYARRAASKFSPKAAKNKWDTIEKSVSSVITKKQTVTHMERDMDRWLRERESKGKKIERFMRKKHRAQEENPDGPKAKEISDQIEQLRADINFIQDNIKDCQANIMQMEESKQDFEEEPNALIEKCNNLEEAKYLLEHFLNLVVNKGLHASQKEAENKELMAKLHQENVNSTLQRDMLQFLIVNQTGIEIDGVDDSLIRDFDDGESDDESSDDDDDDDVISGAIAHLPQDRVLEGSAGGQQVSSGALAEIGRMQGSMQGSTDSLRDSSSNIYGRRDKARRKTTRPEDLLYAGPTPVTNDVTTTSLQTPPSQNAMLHTVPETPEEENGKSKKTNITSASVVTSHSQGPSVNSQGPLSARGRVRHPLDLSSHSKMSSSPSPGMVRKKPNSVNKGDPGPSPSLGRKLPTTSPGLRRKAQSASGGSSGLSVSRTNSTADNAVTTPPGSPAAMRKSRSGGDNVFSRLSSQPASQPANPSNNHDDATLHNDVTDKNHNVTPKSRHTTCGDHMKQRDSAKTPGDVKSPTNPKAERRTISSRRSLTETAKALTINAPAPERKNFTRTGSMRDKRTKTSAPPVSQSSSGPRRSLSATDKSAGGVRRSQTPGRTVSNTIANSGSSRSTSVPPKSPAPNRKMPPSKTPTPTTPRLVRKSSTKSTSSDATSSTTPTTPRSGRKLPETPKMTTRSKSDVDAPPTSRTRPKSASATTPTATRRSIGSRSSSQSNSVRSLSSEDTDASDTCGGILATKRRPHPVMSRGVIQPVSNRPNKTAPLVHAFTAAGHSRAVLHIHATDSLMFSASKDKTAKIWDLTQGEELLTLSDHPNNVNHIRFCEYSGLAFTTCAYFMKVWDPRLGNKCIRTITSAGQMSTGPISIDSISRQISCPPGEAVISDIAINSTGSVLYSAAGNTVKIWDLRTFRVMGKLSGGHQSQIMVLAIDDTDTADGNICVVTGSKDHYIKVFELMEDSVGVVMPRCTLEPPHYDGIQSLCLMGDLLFSGSRDTCIKKWDLAEEQLQHTLTNAHKDWVKGLAFMPGGNCLISGCRSGVVKLWHIDNCTQLGEMQAHRSQINSITTNSSLIFTASDDRAIHFWTSSSGFDQSDASDLE